MEAIRRKLDEADDIAEFIDIMENLSIPVKGCKNIEDMKARIFVHLNSRKDNRLACNEAFKVISEAQTMDKNKSLILLNYYAEVEREIQGLDATFLDLLKTSEGDVLSKIKAKMRRMEERHYVVLVAGETSAGKSSMLNLILGEELLPFSVLSTTSTICELKYGRKKRITIHYKKEGMAPETKNLTESSPYIDQISEFVHVKSASLREKASSYKKVELFWPHRLLQDGVVIVDSPGVGESDIMDDIVVNYLPNAFAFIYVINSSNAGGVQRDRLVRLLHKTRELTTEQQMEFSPNCTLFVCNKWDTIPPSEGDVVIAHIINKLSQCLPDVDINTQIICLSTTKALAAQKYGVMNSEFASLTDKIGCLVSKSIETRLEQHWRWLDLLLSRIAWLMSTLLSNISTDHVAVTARLNAVIERLRKLQAEQESSKEEMKRYLGSSTLKAIDTLIDHLQTPQVVEIFCKWNSDELPAVEKSWEVTKAALVKLLQGRLQMLIEEWEEKQQTFAKARKSVIKKFLEKYNYLERELRNVEVSVSQIQVRVEEETASESVEDQVFNSIYNFSLPFESKVYLGIAIPFLVPGLLVGAALAVPVTLLLLPIVGVKSIADNIKEAKKKSAYKKDRAEYVRIMAQKFLAKAATFEALKPLVEAQLELAVNTLNDLQARIPMLVDADVKLCQQLIEEAQSKKDSEARYKPCRDKCKRLRGELALFGSTEIRCMRLSWDDLSWDVSEDVYLKQTMEPGLYQGHISKGRYSSRGQVTFKVYRELLTRSNIIDCLADEAILRRLCHPHIVTFYGAVFRKVPRGLEAAFVSECPGVDLKYYLIDQAGNCPARNPTTTENAIRWADQVVEALMSIYSIFDGCVHGDLRLKNVLLDGSNLRDIKLSNISLRRQLTIEHGSNCDAFLHLPPEAVRNRNYNASSEIYSLGILFWEMWYGEEAFHDLKGQKMEVFLSSVEGGHRPDLTGITTQTSVMWTGLVSGCWEKIASERSSLADCKSTIGEILASAK